MSLVVDYLDWMICIMWADGVVPPGEADSFARCLESLEVSAKLRKKYQPCLNGTRKINTETTIRRLADTLDHETLAWFIRDSFLMANADGRISEDEVALIRRLVCASRIADTRFDEIREWGEEGVLHLKRGLLLLS